MSKNLIFGEKAKLTTMRLYSWERAPVKAYIKFLRQEKKKEIWRKKNEYWTRNIISEREKLGEASSTKS